MGQHLNGAQVFVGGTPFEVKPLECLPLSPSGTSNRGNQAGEVAFGQHVFAK